MQVLFDFVPLKRRKKMQWRKETVKQWSSHN